jgi:hypothetical protein
MILDLRRLNGSEKNTYSIETIEMLLFLVGILSKEFCKKVKVRATK